MAYQSIVEMTSSLALQRRVAAAAADEGYVGDPVIWAQQNIWHVVSADAGWVAAWDSARASSSDNYNPDTGARDDVITDPMILAVVQPMIAAP
jgi:hypothetical protein